MDITNAQFYKAASRPGISAPIIDPISISSVGARFTGVSVDDAELNPPAVNNDIRTASQKKNAIGSLYSNKDRDIIRQTMIDEVKNINTNAEETKRIKELGWKLCSGINLSKAVTHVDAVS